MLQFILMKQRGVHMEKITAALLAWYDDCARDLPWRGFHNAYKTWVSEAMLQQTRVETVLSYYDAFLARFPTLESLAAASEAEVLKAWEGLGYYSRARNLWQGAQQVMR
jgi:A/G-specific adenine glycosylase